MSMKNPKDLANSPLFGKIAEAEHHFQLDALAKEVRDLYRAGLISATEFEGLVLAGKAQRKVAEEIAESY